jgi:Fic family protein
MNSELKFIIERIDQLLTEVDSYRPLKPEQEQRLLQKIRLDWNFHSSHIEGNSLTYSETKSFLLWHITADGKPFRDYLEMKGHNEAVEYLLDVLKGTEIDLTEHLIRHLHQTILPEEFEADAVTPDGKPTKRIIKPGQYKSVPNHVKTKSGDMFYFSTPEDTPSQMSDLMAWYNKELTETKSHPIIIASLFHYKFVRIHPFDDGNGRMARLLMNLILMKFGYPPVIVPFGIKDDYYNALQFADAEDFDKFIVFIGERLIESLNLVLKVGNNEPIEEFEDIDKIIKLLESKIDGLSEDDEIQESINFDNSQKVFNLSIKPLILKLIEPIEQLSNLFHSSDIYYKINNVKTIIIPILRKDELVQFFDDCYKVIDNNKIIRVIDITFNFNNLKRSAITPYNISYRFEIRFEEKIYHVKSHTSFKPDVKKLYHQQLSIQDINMIIIEIMKFITEGIDGFLNTKMERTP